MINEAERERIYNKIKEEIGENYDLFDINAEIDESLTYEENLRILREKIKEVFNIENTNRQLKEINNKNEAMQKEFIAKERAVYNPPNELKLYTEQNNFLIIGKKGSGKTALAWSFAEKINKESKRKVCVYNHPAPNVLKDLPFNVENINRLEQLFILTDSIVIIDESHEVFNVIDKKINNKLKTLLSRSRQNNTDFIFICHNSYFVNRCLFSFIDVKIIKEVNEGHYELERKHIQRLYEDIVVFGKNNFYIDCDYIRGYQNFVKPSWFNESMSLSYRCNISRKDFFK